MASMAKVAKQKHRAEKKKQMKAHQNAKLNHERQRILLKKQNASTT